MENSRCREYELKVQALIDGEIKSDKEQLEIFTHLSECETCREDYNTISKLIGQVGLSEIEAPTEEWFELLEKKRSITIFRRIGYFLIIVPYILIIGVGLKELFMDRSEGLLIKGSIAAIITGFLLLLILTIMGRVKESKNDKYKEIML